MASSATSVCETTVIARVYSYEPFKCYCPHTLERHALIRCGHPNDRPSDHPLSHADDALHRVWCSECQKWCFSHRSDCPVFKNPDMDLCKETEHDAIEVKNPQVQDTYNGNASANGSTNGMGGSGSGSGSRNGGGSAAPINGLRREGPAGMRTAVGVVSEVRQSVNGSGAGSAIFEEHSSSAGTMTGMNQGTVTITTVTGATMRLRPATSLRQDMMHGRLPVKTML